MKIQHETEDSYQCAHCGKVPTEEDCTCVMDRRGITYVCCDEECASIFKQEFSEIL